MALNLNSVMLGSEDPKKLAAFYDQVFGKSNPNWTDEDNGWYGWEVGKGGLIVGPHSEVHGQSKEPSRIMLGIETQDVKGEFDRIKAAGAKVVAEPYHPGQAGENSMMLATLADPDGNYFQLASPWEEPKK